MSTSQGVRGAGRVLRGANELWVLGREGGSHPSEPEAAFQGPTFLWRMEDKVFLGALRRVVLPSRSVLGCDLEDGPSFLLTASPEWWLGKWGHGRATFSSDQEQALGPQPS